MLSAICFDYLDDALVQIDVVFGGRNTSLTLVRWISVSCDEALSENKRTFPLFSSSNPTFLAKWS